MVYYGRSLEEKKLDDKFDKWFLDYNKYRSLYPRSYITDPLLYRWRLKDLYRNSYLSTKYNDSIYNFDYSHWKYLYNREKDDYRRYLYDRERRKLYEDLSMSIDDVRYKYPYLYDSYYYPDYYYP
ncbi:unnamed protein product [Nezara viridula]|uniref:Uncharacterized protein n=1 Tax=Nezara viridula TaxID=85310 RepID=A0A9P0MH14_NEZVI|nr:unnamed protein product [Nezara viridula]